MTDMASREEKSDHKKLTVQLLLIAMIMLVSMTAYEYLKQVILPNITIWQSHMVTIIFSTICATVASFFILRRHIKLIGSLQAKTIENEHLQNELKKKLEDLTVALSKVKTLSGFLPICASCKKIRDDKGYWNQIEIYIKDHSEADFSHGICPQCATRMYPEYIQKQTDL